MTAWDDTKRSDKARGPKYTRPKNMRAEKKTPPMISDHALLRYFERVLGLDVEALRQTMLTPQQIQQVRDMGKGEIRIGGGHVVRVEGSRVVTLF